MQRLPVLVLPVVSAVIVMNLTGFYACSVSVGATRSFSCCLWVRSKPSGNWHWETQMFMWSQSKWIYVTQQCVGEEEEEDWSRLEKRDIYTFLKAFVRIDCLQQHWSGKKKTTSGLFLSGKAVPFSDPECHFCSVSYSHHSIWESRYWREVSLDSSGVCVLSKFRLSHICTCIHKCNLCHCKLMLVSDE